MHDRHMVLVAVYLLLIKDGRILLSRRYKTGWQDGSYSLVAGHLEEGETISATMIREAKEEADIEIQREDLALAHTLHRKTPDREYIDLFFSPKQWSGEAKNMEPDKCNDLSWFPLDRLPENLLPYIRNVIECTRRGIAFSESGWNGDAL